MRTTRLKICAGMILAVLITPCAFAQAVDLVLIEKNARHLTLFAGDKPVATYSVALGGSPVGAKNCQGDRKTPEGSYSISGRNTRSKFHKSLRVSYPNDMDRARAKSLHCEPGGDIMIHGLPNGRGWLGATHRAIDWTDGCIAVTNEQMDEIWKLVRDGTKVKIEP